jgi:hypothetical protein
MRSAMGAGSAVALPLMPLASRAARSVTFRIVQKCIDYHAQIYNGLGRLSIWKNYVLL